MKAHQTPAPISANPQHIQIAHQPYNKVAVVLHWGMAVLLLGLIVLGSYMHELPLSPEKLRLYSWHKWAGITALLLVFVRIVWRITHPAPALPATMSIAMQRLAQLGHVGLYALMFAIPFSGWLMSSAKGFQTVWFGVLPLPDLVSKNAELAAQFAKLHEGLNAGLIALLLGHIAAALYHHVVLRDGLLRRMTWMASMLAVLLCGGVLFGLSSQPSYAVEYTKLQADKSKVGFVYTQMGVTMEGKFTQFAADLRLDPAKPSQAQANLRIDLASIDAGSSEANSELAGKAWFNTKTYPTAQFTLSQLRPLGDERYEASGKLSIKGRSQDIRLPVSLTTRGQGMSQSATFSGTFTLKRADFAIGEGIWADFATVANEVQIRFVLHTLNR